MAVVSAAVPASTVSHDDSHWLRLLTPAPTVNLVGPLDGARLEVEQHVANRYLNAYGAHVSHFLPWFLTLECLGSVTGVAGMQVADAKPLFLEQYLDQPAQQVLSARIGQPVARGAMVEIGNLVAAKRGASHLLFLLFTATLHAAGYEWIVFTATHALRNSLEKLGFPMITLQDVDTGKLDPALLAQWGSYYRTDPVVVAGSLASAAQIIASRPLLRRVLRLYRTQINALATELRRA